MLVNHGFKDGLYRRGYAAVLIRPDWLASAAVKGAPCSTPIPCPAPLQFPANKEFCRAFFKIRASGTPETLNSNGRAGRYTKFPYSTEQGIISAEQVTGPRTETLNLKT
jgi:hypothetical protein